MTKNALPGGSLGLLGLQVQDRRFVLLDGLRVRQDLGLLPLHDGQDPDDRWKEKEKEAHLYFTRF